MDCYFPDPPFDAYEHERYYHRGWRFYAPDPPCEVERSVAPDYVPAYSWLQSATEQLRERVRPSRHVESATTQWPALRLLPDRHSEPAPTSMPPIFLDDEEISARLSLIEAKRQIDFALAMYEREPNAYEWCELAPYVETARRSLTAFERAAKPRNSFLRLVDSFKKS